MGLSCTAGPPPLSLLPDIRQNYQLITLHFQNQQNQSTSFQIQTSGSRQPSHSESPLINSESEELQPILVCLGVCKAREAVPLGLKARFLCVVS